MRPGHGWGPAFGALVALGCASAHGGPPAPVLEFRIDLGKRTEFFEGEPIYAVLTVRNASADTIQITHSGLIEPWLQWSLRRSDGTHVPHRPDVHVDWECAARSGVCRIPTDPLAPGAARYRPVVLQRFWGDEGPLYHGSFSYDLPAGGYVLDASFRSDDSVAASVAALPVSFRVRPRTQREDTAYAEFVRWGAIDVRQWTDANLDSALTWVSQRLASDSADPFSAALLTSSAARTERPPIDSAKIVRYYDLMLAIAQAQAMRPLGAFAAIYLVGSGFKHFGHPTLDVPARLGATLAGDVAREFPRRYQ